MPWFFHAASCGSSRLRFVGDGSAGLGAPREGGGGQEAEGNKEEVWSEFLAKKEAGKKEEATQEEATKVEEAKKVFWEKKEEAKVSGWSEEAKKAFEAKKEEAKKARRRTGAKEEPS